MKTMAAKMAEKGDEIGTAIDLWTAVYENNQDTTVRDNAMKHLKSLRADMDIEELERRVQLYQERAGSLPATWADLVRTGILPGVPIDPSGAPYELRANGTVWVTDTEQMPFVGQGRLGKDR
jgi:hypothetical protein